MDSETPFYIRRLRLELAERRQRNPRYSIRAMAKALEIENSTLVRILNERTVPGRKTAMQIAKRLDLSDSAAYEFVQSVDRETVKRNELPLPAELDFSNLNFDQDAVSLEMLTVFAHLGSLGDKTTVEAVRAKANLDDKTLAEHLNTMVAIGLIQCDGDEITVLRLNAENNDKKHPSARIKQLVSESLHAAAEYLEEFDPEQSKFETMTMAINPELLPEAKARIEAFVHDMTHFLQHDGAKSAYQLAVQLYPVKPRHAVEPTPTHPPADTHPGD